MVQNSYGRMGWDVPNRFMSWGYLPTPLKNWSVAFLLETHSGFPFSLERDDGSILGDLNSRRYPLFFELDLLLEHRFSLAGKRMAVRGGFNNIIHHRNPTVGNSIIGSPDFL